MQRHDAEGVGYWNYLFMEFLSNIPEWLTGLISTAVLMVLKHYLLDRPKFKKYDNDMIDLRERAALFDAYFDFSEDGKIVVKDGKVIRANHTMGFISGYAPSELIQLESVDELVQADKRAKHKHYREGYDTIPSFRDMANGREVPLRHKTGRMIDVVINLTPVLLPVSGQVTAVSVRRAAEIEKPAPARKRKASAKK